MRRLLLLPMTLALGLALASNALAARSVVHDPRDARVCGKVRNVPSVDILEASARHTADGTIEHVIRFRRPNRDNTAIAIKVGAEKEPRYYVTPAGGAPRKVYVSDSRSDDYSETGRFIRRGKRLIFKFDSEAIGSPRSYRWQVLAYYGSGDCRGLSGDLAPNQGKPFKPHDLTKPSTPAPVAIPATGRKATFTAVCRLANPCQAQVTVAQGRKTLARGSYSIPAHSSREVSVDLTGAGRRALRHGRVGARLTILDKQSGKRETIPVVLKRR